MPGRHALHLAICVATIAFAFALALPAFVPIPVLWYAPNDHAWSFEVHAHGIAMDFYGRCLFASAASALAGVVTYAYALRRRRAPIALFTTWALSLTLLVIAFYVWRLVHRAL
jgi:hypothetical protein